MRKANGGKGRAVDGRKRQRRVKSFGSAISWAICKSAPRSRQKTTPAPHHSIFYRSDALRVANQQRQSTEGKVGRHFLSLNKQPLFTFRTCSLAATIVKHARRPSYGLRPETPIVNSRSKLATESCLCFFKFSSVSEWCMGVRWKGNEESVRGLG